MAVFERDPDVRVDFNAGLIIDRNLDDHYFQDEAEARTVIDRALLLAGYGIWSGVRWDCSVKYSIRKVAE